MRPLRAGDAWELCQNLRAADEAELIAGGEVNGPAGVLYAVQVSTVAWAFELDGAVGALFGVMQVEPGRYALWMLTSELFSAHPRAFVRAIRRNLPCLRRAFGEFFNFIDARYTGALRLAASLGATFGSPINHNGHVFVPFTFARL